MKRLCFFLITVGAAGALAFVPTSASGQADISGSVVDSDTREPLPSATVMVDSTSFGGMTDAQGRFRISRVPNGAYILKVSFLGYITASRSVQTAGKEIVVAFALKPTTLAGKEIVVEVNRARERETPVAFSNVTAEKIGQEMHGQDAPLLVKGTPGVYAFSSDGVGNGEAKLFVRGFSQEYVQVLINGVPTNDPESNAVYWSNWGSVSSAAQSIQVQRGAGSSLYGAGSFGGSFNIVTKDPAGSPYYGGTLSLGDPRNTVYGVNLNTGLLGKRFSMAFKASYKLGDGGRVGGIYKGVNYYLSTSWFIDARQTLKMVFHGAPQEHSYSFSAGVDFFKKFGYGANPSPYLPRSLVEALPASGSGLPNYGLLDGRREVMGSDYVSLSHNHFHKPQLEFHHSYEFSEATALRSTFFYSKGSGGASSLNGAPSAASVDARRDPDGVLRDVAYVRDTYLKDAYQRDSYSLHRQFGLMSNFDTQLKNKSKLTLGGEFRSWAADHPGFFTNLYGKTFITDRRYAYRKPDGTFADFRRKNYEGDLSHESDAGNPFNWDPDEAAAKDPTFRAQYRNYRGETPQFTLFGSGNWRLSERLNALTTLQYVWYEYHIKERMPSENAIGVPAPAGTVSSEGPDGSGNFYMQDANTPTQFYRFKLVDETRKRGFWQPKVGLNYNLTKALNAFGNFAHVERFVNLDIFYNFGIINPAAEDEKSNQFEGGLGWKSDDLAAKLNGYTIVWDNKSTRITDPSKAGEPGYDRNGNRTELIGRSRHRGVEVEVEARLHRLIPVRGLSLKGSLTFMDNRWTKVLDQVKVNPALGSLQEDTNLNGVLDPGEDTNGNKRLDDNRRVFASGSTTLDKDGKPDAVYFEELRGTHVANQPQTAVSVELNYRHPKGMFANVDLTYYGRDYTVDGDSYRAVDGYYDTAGKFVVTRYSNQTPSRAVVDVSAGHRFQVDKLKLEVTAQVLNLFDKKYYSSADRFGFFPGALRTFRVNVNTGF